MHAVVLRAEGDRAFSAGLDTKKSYGQPDDIWNHEDPGELLSPKWQKVWKPVVCAVQGICTAGAFYFLNEADIVICSDDATFFDSHVTYGLVCALEPVGLMRKVGLAQSLRIALMGNDERVTAATALQIGLVTEVVDRGDLWARAQEIAAGIAAKPSSATQGTVRAIWESLDRPYRAAMEQGLIYTRLGNPIGQAEVAAEPARQGRAQRSDERTHRLSTRIAEVLAIDPSAGALEFEGTWWTYGQLADTVEQTASLVPGPGAEVGILLRNRPVSIGFLLGVLQADGCIVTINPGRGRDRTREDIAELDLPVLCGQPDDLADLVPDELAAATTVAGDELGEPLVVEKGTHDGGVARPRRGGADAHQRHHRPAEADRPHLRDARAGARRQPALRLDPREQHAAAPRRRHRQLTARAPRRPLPRAVVHHRRPLVLVPREVHRRRLARRGAPPPAGHREPRAHRPPHGAGGRSRPRRPGQPQVGRVRHRAARSRRRRRVHGALRRAGARHLRGDGVRRQRGGLEREGPPRPLGRQARERRPRPGRVRAARRRPRDGRRAADPTPRASSRCGPATSPTAAGSAPPTSPASTTTGSSTSWAGPTRPSSAAASRCCPRPSRPRSSDTPRSEGRR